MMEDSYVQKKYNQLYSSDIFNRFPPKEDPKKKNLKMNYVHENFLKHKEMQEKMSSKSNNFDTIYNISYGIKPITNTNNKSYYESINNKYVIPGYDSKKRLVNSLKSNIFCESKGAIKDNINISNIHRNDWYSNLDWRSGKSELIFINNSHKKYYDTKSADYI